VKILDAILAALTPLLVDMAPMRPPPPELVCPPPTQNFRLVCGSESRASKVMARGVDTLVPEADTEVVAIPPPYIVVPTAGDIHRDPSRAVFIEIYLNLENQPLRTHHRSAKTIRTPTVK